MPMSHINSEFLRPLRPVDVCIKATSKSNKEKPYGTWQSGSPFLCPEKERATWGRWPIENIPLEKGRVNYLTIQEGWVEAGESQRRPGLHVDSPGEVKIKNGELEQLAEGQGDSQAYEGHHWGLGCCQFIPHKPHKAISF